MAASTAKKPTAYREGRADKSKKPSIEIEIKPEGEEEEGPEGEEMDASKPHSRKRSAKGAKQTKAPMDGGMYGKKPMDGEGCNCGKRKASCDGSCGKKMDRNDALTPQEYLAACDLGIQGRSRTYIRARLDAAERLDLKCGKGSISEGEKCTKGAATRVSPEVAAAKNIAARTAKSGNLIEYSNYNRKTGSLQKGPSAAIQLGQAAKGVGLGVLEAGKWVSGYNIGKTLATGITGGKNEKASGGAKAAAVVGSTLLTGISGGVGAARRVGAFGMTDLQQHAQNEKKEKAWRKSVGYKDGMYAKGFKVDYAQLGM